MKKVLIAEDNPELQGLVQANIETFYDVEILLADNGQEAIKLIDKYSTEICLIVSDYQMPLVNGGQVFQHLKSKNLNIPFILATGTEPENCTEVIGEKIFALVRKPFFGDTLYREIGRALKPALSVENKKNIENKEDNEYFRVRKSLISLVSVVKFDVFIKLGTNHFVKVISANTDSRDLSVDSALNKDVVWFYCLKSQYKNFSENYVSSIMALIQVNDIQGSGLDLLSDQVELVNELQSHFKWGQQLLEIVNTNIKLAVQLLEKTPKLKDQLFKIEKADSREYIYKHSAMISYASAGVLSAVDSFSFEKHIALVAAGIVHDMYLTVDIMQNIEKIHEAAKDPNNHTEDVALYRDHPELVAIDVESKTSFDQVVPIILRQHHELPDGKGFPFGLEGDQIDFLSAVFIVSQHLIDYTLKKSKVMDYSAFFEENKILFKGEKFKQIMDALKHQLESN